MLGTVSLDIGLKWLVTHKIGPDLDTERELLFTDLQGTQQAASTNKSFCASSAWKNFSGDAFLLMEKFMILS